MNEQAGRPTAEVAGLRIGELNNEGKFGMSPEIFWLTLTTLVTALLFAPNAYNSISRISLLEAFRRQLPEWGNDESLPMELG